MNPHLSIILYSRSQPIMVNTMKHPTSTVSKSTLHALGILLTASLWFFAAGVSAQETQFVEGGHYELLRETQPVQTGDKIEVVEMFWYQCPHCYRLEPYITQWRENKPDNAEFVPVPAILNERWAFDARMYYTLEALGLDRQLHADIFKAIHETRLPLNSVERFADWAAENGADRQAVLAAFNSFGVENKLNFATVMSRKYGLTGVPAIIVDGKYRTSVSLAGSHEKLLEVIDYLVKLAAEQRAG